MQAGKSRRPQYAESVLATKPSSMLISPTAQVFRNLSKATSVNRTRDKCHVRLESGQELVLHNQACIGPGDLLSLNPPRLYVVCVNGLAQVLPPFLAVSEHKIAGKLLDICIKEPTTDYEKNAIEFLRNFHYRKGSPFGRRASLVAKVQWEGQDQVIGFIELSSAPLLNSARDRVLNDRFQSNTISWTKWGYDTRRKFAKTIVEISRVVVHPQFRSFGVSRLLLEHAFRYARTHWQIGGVKPVFAEIVAEMLRLLPFVSSAGMSYVGDTKGNVDRICYDLRYYFKKKELHDSNVGDEPSFIRMQVHYLRNALQLMHNRNIPTIEDLIEYLRRASTDHSGKASDPVVSKIIRTPRPTFLVGLDRRATDFIRRRVRELGLIGSRQSRESPIISHSRPIIASDLSIDLSLQVPRTGVSAVIAKAFGIDERRLVIPIVHSFNLTINPGQIVLITGPSGAGKTTLLNSLIGEVKPKLGKVSIPNDVKIGRLRRLSPKLPIVDAIGLPAEESVRILSTCGLNDTRCYLAPFEQLSAGEKYRAMIAKLIASKRNVWVVDDFLCNVDATTAQVVAEGFNGIAKLHRATVLASTSRSDIANGLSPDIVVHKLLGPAYRIMTGQAFDRLVRANRAFEEDGLRKAQLI